MVRIGESVRTSAANPLVINKSANLKSKLKWRHTFAGGGLETTGGALREGLLEEHDRAIEIPHGMAAFHPAMTA